jgi:hypothetical protein
MFIFVKARGSAGVGEAHRPLHAGAHMPGRTPFTISYITSNKRSTEIADVLDEVTMEETGLSKLVPVPAERETPIEWTSDGSAGDVGLGMMR